MLKKPNSVNEKKSVITQFIRFLTESNKKQQLFEKQCTFYLEKVFARIKIGNESCFVLFPNGQ